MEHDLTIRDRWDVVVEGCVAPVVPGWVLDRYVEFVAAKCPPNGAMLTGTMLSRMRPVGTRHCELMVALVEGLIAGLQVTTRLRSH